MCSLGSDAWIAVHWTGSLGPVGSNTNKGAAIRLDNDVKSSIADFLGHIQIGRIDDYWLYLLHENGVDIYDLPYFYVQGGIQKDHLFGFIYANSVMTWHIAPCYCELAEQELDPLLSRSKEEARIGRETAATYYLKMTADCFNKAAAYFKRGGGVNFRRVAIALSKYCAYLVVSAPELLPGPSADVKHVHDNFAEKARAALRGDKGRIFEAVAGDDPFWTGVAWGKRFLGETPPPSDIGPCSDPWKALVLVWMQMLVYAAPYGDVEAHMRHLSQGGKFITHLWALLYHLGIRKWRPPRIEEEESPEDSEQTKEEGQPEEEEEDSEDGGQIEEDEGQTKEDERNSEDRPRRRIFRV